MSFDEFAWAVGLFEGEGSFYCKVDHRQRHLRFLHAWVEQHGKPPISTQWRRAIPGVAMSTATIDHAWGSWSNFIRAGGYA